MSLKQFDRQSSRILVHSHWALAAGIAALAIALYVLLLLSALAVHAAGPGPGNGGDKIRGLLVSRPATGVIGEWKIGDALFQADAATTTKEENGPLAAGACTEVEFHAESGVKHAAVIRSLPSGECTQNGTETPESTETPEATETPHPGGEGHQAFGKIDSLPAVGLLGQWVISGVPYSVTQQTHLHQEDGPFAVDTCVELEYKGQSAPFIALTIHTDDGNCDKPGATPTPKPSFDDRLQVFGRIITMPIASLIGTWDISGTTYSTTNQTEFDQRNGAFAPGICVRLHTTTATAPFTVREMRSVPDFRCDRGNGDDHKGKGVLFGTLQSFPPDLIGEWNIGGMTFVVTKTTEIKQEHTPFTVGITVKVQFVVDANGVNQARKIEAKFRHDHEGHDDDHDGIHEGEDGHAFGPIDSFPANLIGKWIIGTLAYTATADTKFEQEHGAFAQGVNVRVEFHLDADGNRLADEIQSTADRGDVTDHSHALLVGFVQQMPTTGFVGEWIVGDVTFTSTLTTKFNQEHGALGIGAYVTVEYSGTNNVNVMYEIKTHVPPGAGDDSHIGKIEKTDDSNATAAALSAVRTWQIGGVTYVINAATDFNSALGGLSVGGQAMVNSYVDASGNQVATRIQGVNLNHAVYLPVTSR